MSTKYSALSRETKKFEGLPPSHQLTLYPACSRVGRESLVLEHSTPHLPKNSGSNFPLHQSDNIKAPILLRHD